MPRLLIVLASTCLVAACTPALPAPGPATPTPGPSAAAGPGVRDQLAIVAGVASANAIANQAEKASVIGGNAGSFISTNSGGFISTNGGGFISTNGGGIVAQGGGNYGLLADAPAFAADAQAGETVVRRFEYVNGVRLVTFRGTDGTRRQVLLTADGQAVGQTTDKVKATYAKGDIKQGQVVTVRRGVDRSFQATYTTDFAEDGSLVATTLTDGHVQGAGGVAIDVQEQVFDLLQGTGHVTVSYKHLGLVEKATLRNVRLDQAEEDVFGSTDALGLYEGEAQLARADGTPLFTKRQTRKGTRLVRELAFPDGLTLSLSWNRDARSFTGPVTRAGQALGTATLRLAADGAVGIALQPADPAQAPVVLGYGADGKALDALPPAPAPAPASGERWRVDTIAGINQRGFADGSTAGDDPVLFNGPTAIAHGGKYFYLTDAQNGRIRRFTLTERPDGLPVCTFETLAGNGGTGFADGNASVARFQHPDGLAATQDDVVYVTDGNRVRRIASDGTVSTLAGGQFGGHEDGKGAGASFFLPDGLTLMPDGALVVVDAGNYLLRRVTPDGSVTTLAGSGQEGHANGPAAQASFKFPTSVAVNGQGDVFVTDLIEGSLRRLSSAGLVEDTLLRGDRFVVLDGAKQDAAVILPQAPAFGPHGELYFTDGGVIRRMDADGHIRTIAGSGSNAAIDGPMEDAGFHYVTGIWVDPSGDKLLVVDQGASALRWVRRLP